MIENAVYAAVFAAGLVLSFFARDQVGAGKQAYEVIGAVLMSVAIILFIAEFVTVH